MSFAIVVDSTCDLLEDEYRSLNVAMVPLTIGVGGAEFKDQVEISSEEFLERMAAAEDLPKTSQPSPYDFTQVFNKLAADGAEGVLSIHIAGVLSGTVESARAAADEVEAEVHVIDTCGATASSALVVQQACALRDAGLSVAEAAERLQAYLPKVRFFVAPDTLENLLKGGRLSADQAQSASLLNNQAHLYF